MPNRYFSLLFLLLLSGFALAQNGSIAGQVVDYKTKEAIIGASVVIQGTTVGSATDIEGNFLISNVKPGTYTIVVSYIAYKTQTIPDVVVESGNKTTLSVDLPEDVAELQEIVITARKEIASDVNLMKSIRDSKLVVSGISSEQIVRLPDRDAAQIAQRVPGVTIADNRFVVVRGVPQRYNQVLINGAIGPSTETDSRSFSFDLIPSGFIDQMLIYKSATAEKPGDFAGGLIQIITKEPTGDNFIKFGVSAGFRQYATFENYLSPNGSPTDGLGFDNGFRNLPDNFPSTTLLKSTERNSSVRERAGKSLTNNFGLNERTAPVDLGANFTTSQSFNIGRIRAGNYTSLSYSRSYTNVQAEFNRFNEFTNNTLSERFLFQDRTFGDEVRLSGMHNWDFKFNDRHRIEFKNFFVQLGETRTTVRGGNDFIQQPNFDRINYAYYYLSRGIYSGQLQGHHELGNSSKIDWVFGTNYIKKQEPDFRRFRTLRDRQFRGSEEPFTMQLPPNSNLFDASRFWSDLTDIGISHALNFEKKFGKQESKRVPTLRAGYLGEYRTRDFSARYLSYLAPDPSAVTDIIRQPLSTVFSPANVRRLGGLVIEEGTNQSDSYSGTNQLVAGYLAGSVPLGKFDVNAGFRGEYNVQTLRSISNLGPVNVNNPVFAPLPSLNVAYNLSDRSLVRVAYSRTVNRPEFRELAPFLFYQFEFDANIIGSPNLKTAFVSNLDARWEMYPNPGEVVSIGAFYKKFKDPIELYNLIVGESPQFFYANSPEAYSAGAEMEVRKSLASLGVSKFLRNTTLNFNAAYIQSQVDVGSDPRFANQARFRPLTGQSPYIINFGAYYNDEESGFSVNAAYNVFGRRIFVVGDVLYPTWFEMPRNILDLQIAKEFKQRFELKFNVQNLLNARYAFRQDNTNNSTIEASDPIMRAFRMGAQYTLSFSVKVGN
jgi:outer membrane receptor protein involved in Fe transport